MKTRLSGREIALITLPTLAIAAFAFYLMRVEAVSAPGGSHAFVSKVELQTASGLSMSGGTSHYLIVMVEHPWPRPKWWGKGETANAVVDAFTVAQAAPKQSRYRGERPGQFFYVASGGALTWEKKGKRHRFEPQSSTSYQTELMGHGRWDGEGRMVFRHSLPLQDVSIGDEALTFHGLYFLEGQKPLRLSRVIKERGKPLKWNRSRDTGGKLQTLKATPFKAMLWSNSPHEDRCDISIVVSHALRENGKAPDISEFDLEIIDGRGQNLKIDQRNIILAYPGSEHKNTATTTEHPFIINIKRNYATQEPLTLRGKIRVDENWPILFSLKLPPR